MKKIGQSKVTDGYTSPSIKIPNDTVKGKRRLTAKYISNEYYDESITRTYLYYGSKTWVHCPPVYVYTNEKSTVLKAFIYSEDNPVNTGKSVIKLNKVSLNNTLIPSNGYVSISSKISSNMTEYSCVYGGDTKLNLSSGDGVGSINFIKLNGTALTIEVLDLFVQKNESCYLTARVYEKGKPLNTLTSGTLTFYVNDVKIGSTSLKSNQNGITKLYYINDTLSIGVYDIVCVYTPVKTEKKYSSMSGAGTLYIGNYINKPDITRTSNTIGENGKQASYTFSTKNNLNGTVSLYIDYQKVECINGDTNGDLLVNQNANTTFVYNFNVPEDVSSNYYWADGGYHKVFIKYVCNDNVYFYNVIADFFIKYTTKISLIDYDTMTYDNTSYTVIGGNLECNIKNIDVDDDVINVGSVNIVLTNSNSSSKYNYNNISVIDGKITQKLPNSIPNGAYNLTISFTDSSNVYDDSKVTFKYIYKKYNSYFTISADKSTINCGELVTVTAILKDDDGTVLKDVPIVSKINSSLVDTTITDNYGKITRQYIGQTCNVPEIYTFKSNQTSNYASCTGIITINRTNRLTYINVSDSTIYTGNTANLTAKLYYYKKILNDDGSISKTVIPINDESIVFTSNDTVDGNNVEVILGSATTNSNGIATFSKKFITVSKHTINVTYDNVLNSEYASSSNKYILTVAERISTVMDKNTGSSVYSVSTPVSVTLKDVNGNVLTGKTIVFKYNTVVVATCVTDSNGVASFNFIPDVVGTLTIGVVYRVVDTDKYAQSTTTYKLNVSRASSSLTVTQSATSLYYTQELVLTGTLKNSSNNTVLSNQKIELYDNNTLINTGNTSSKGVIVFKLKPDAGKHSYILKYNGNTNINGTASTVKSTVNKLQPILKLDKTSYNIYAFETFTINAYLYNLTVTDSSIHELTDEPLVITGGGVNDTIETDAYGKCKKNYKLNLERTSFQMMVTYAGNTNYNSVSQQVNISITTRVPFFTQINQTFIAYLEDYLKTNLSYVDYNGISQGVNGYVVSWYVDNTSIGTSVTDSNGDTSIKYRFTSTGEHIISIIFEGYKHKDNGDDYNDLLYNPASLKYTISVENIAIVDLCNSLATFNALKCTGYPKIYGSSITATGGAIVDGYVTTYYGWKLRCTSITTTDNCLLQMIFKASNTDSKQYGVKMGLHDIQNQSLVFNWEDSDENSYFLQYEDLVPLNPDKSGRPYTMNEWHTLNIRIKNKVITTWIDEGDKWTMPTLIKGNNGCNPYIISFHKNTRISLSRINLIEY